MDKKAVEVMSQVTQKLVFARVSLSELFKDNPKQYLYFRELIYDCEELMSKYCDCAPIKLIAGQVDDIVMNLESQKV